MKQESEIVTCGTLTMEIPKLNTMQKREALKQNLVDALFEKMRERPKPTEDELDIFLQGYMKGKLNRRGRSQGSD